jgi:hypothetical protein
MIVNSGTRWLPEPETFGSKSGRGCRPKGASWPSAAFLRWASKWCASVLEESSRQSIKVVEELALIPAAPAARRPQITDSRRAGVFTQAQKPWVTRLTHRTSWQSSAATTLLQRPMRLELAGKVTGGDQIGKAPSDVEAANLGWKVRPNCQSDYGRYFRSPEIAACQVTVY